jgi:uncharacterized membrane protein
MNSSKIAQLVSGLLCLSFSIKSLITQLDFQSVCIILIFGSIYTIFEYIESKIELNSIKESLLKIEEENVKHKIETIEKVDQLNTHLTALKVRDGFKNVRF